MTRAALPLLILVVALGARLVPALIDRLPAVGSGLAMGGVLMICGAALALDALAGPRPPRAA